MQRWIGSPWRRGVLALASVATLAGWASTAQATVHHLSGNLRLQVGNGLPLPITAAPVPEGRIVAAPGATLMQTAGSNPKKLSLPHSALTAPGTPLTLPLLGANSAGVFQLKTNLSAGFPGTLTSMGGAAGPAVFSAGGRTGGMTETWCPGSGATPPFACAGPSVGWQQAQVNGLLRYTATKSQFGGPARIRFGGSADVALQWSASPPCSYAGGADPSCKVAMGRTAPTPIPALGGPWGGPVTWPATAPASGVLYVTATAGGLIVAATPTAAMGDGVPNQGASFGGPWTTGMLTVSVTNNVGLVSVYVFSGSDRRAVNGAGALSLVSGSVSSRNLVGPKANRGWLHLEIGPPTGAVVPGLPLPALVALAASTALSGGYVLGRGRRRA